ncbi:ejaculatory bulb-specific protein 3 [Agrilus planipennis]|uniref:Ejaculatory bulb-specific protein 3 n=1 Tax=Agrilus planipennis TaxID=224129 RepID=A0A1W4WUU5_AGRPL|nr:ejaculatory bulb-specific protein 3 [Agrilus planipennis]
MKSFAIVTLLAVAMAVVYAAPDGVKFTTKYDNIDLDEILQNERLFNNYFKCLTGEGKCTPDGEELKKDIPEALKNKCGGCSEKQREGAKKVVQFLVKNKPEQFKKLEQLYDPEGNYRRDNKELLEKEGIHL